MEDNNLVKVLLVDDEEAFLKTAKATLQKRGFEVAVASGGSPMLSGNWQSRIPTSWCSM